ncbi:UNVERIFIED_CONTAM: hypothetical protein PYX00_009781 [Menopon gallinae]|uniref:Uncharacterized protein n=1 Tax=Menopon gallinae TaxID=328185 RepID=A0AAW2HCX6_9NEOP
MVPDMIYSFTYPVLTSKRFGRSGPVPQSAYMSMPMSMTQRFSAYQPPDYEDSYVPYSQQEDYEYNIYGKYPMMPMYFPEKEESYGYVEEQPETDPIMDLQEEMMEEDREQSYPYGHEKWFEGSDGNSEANAAFMQNVMQMYQDGGSPSGYHPFVYAQSVENYPAEDEEVEEREWSYGVPVTEVEDDESVKELESLRRPVTGKVVKSKEETRPLSKEEIFRNLRLQKQMSRNSRKTPGEEFRVNKKQLYDHEEHKPKKEGKSSFSDRKGKALLTTTAIPSTPRPTTTTERSSKNGQKEYVLPRPANPVRRPYDNELSRRSVEQASVYDTIKKLLAMEEGLRKSNGPRLRKRFVLSEDQLTSELSGLKKIAV